MTRMVHQLPKHVTVAAFTLCSVLAILGSTSASMASKLATTKPGGLAPSMDGSVHLPPIPEQVRNGA